MPISGLPLVRSSIYTQPVRPASASRLARLAVDHRIEQHHRACRVIVPDVVVHLLEMPAVCAGLGIDRHDRGAEQVVALAHRAVIVRPAIAGGEIQQALAPDRAPACSRWWRRRASRAVVPAGQVSLPTSPGAGSVYDRHRILPVFASSAVSRPRTPNSPPVDATVDDAVVVERRAGDAVAVLPVLDRRLPHLLAGLHVERHDVGVELAEEDHSFAHRQPAIEPAAADGGDLLVDAGPALPNESRRSSAFSANTSSLPVTTYMMPSLTSGDASAEYLPPTRSP